MRIFPIYESSILLNNRLPPNERLSKYVCYSVGDVDIIICFYKSQPINMRWFDDHREYLRFIKYLKKTFIPYEEYKEEFQYCQYPSLKENIPF